MGSMLPYIAAPWILWVDVSLRRTMGAPSSQASFVTPSGVSTQVTPSRDTSWRKEKMDGVNHGHWTMEKWGWKHMKTCFFHGFEPWISWMMKFMAVERWTRQFHHEQIKVSPWKNGSLIRTNMDKWTLKHEQWINMRSNGGKCTFNHQASAWWKMRTFQSYLVCLRKKKIPWIYISWPVLDTLLFV